MKLVVPTLAALALALPGCWFWGDTSTGTGGAPTTSATGGATGSTTSTTTAGVDAGVPCTSDTDCAGSGLSCCAGQCVNTRNDLKNCGACGVTCDPKSQYCDGDACVTPACTTTVDCSGLCCSAGCCTGGQICCAVQMPGPLGAAKCVDPVNGTCPIGCPLCK